MKRLFIMLVAIATLGLVMCNQPVEQENVQVDSTVVVMDTVLSSDSVIVLIYKDSIS